jgi:hypothetical protein
VLSGGGVLVQAWRNTSADPAEVSSVTSNNTAFTANNIALPPLALAWPGGKPPAALDDYVGRVERWQGLLPLTVRVSGPGGTNVMGVRLQVRVQPAPALAKTSDRRRRRLQQAAGSPGPAESGSPGAGDVRMVRPGEASKAAGNITLLGAECVSNAAGLANFSSVQFKVRAPPGDYLLSVVAPDYPEVPSLTAPMEVRSCVVGEVRGPGGDSCEQCVDDTWSRNPDNATCDVCVSHADCNGSSIAPDAGYWHSVPESVQVHACPNAEACKEGGVCADGYQGTM